MHEMGPLERWRESEIEQKRAIASAQCAIVNVSDRPIDLPTDQSTKIWNRLAARMKDSVAILLWLLPIWKSKTAIVHSDTRWFDQSALIVYRESQISLSPFPPRVYLLIHLFTYFSVTPSEDAIYPSRSLRFFSFVAMPISTTHF